MKTTAWPGVPDNKQTFFDNAADYGLEKHSNVGTVSPKVNDILAFAGGTYGHVAIISAVVPTGVNQYRIDIVEQNWEVDGTYSLSMNFDPSSGKYTVQNQNRDSYSIIGWLRIPYSARLKIQDPASAITVHAGETHTFAVYYSNTMPVSKFLNSNGSLDWTNDVPDKTHTLTAANGFRDNDGLNKFTYMELHSVNRNGDPSANILYPGDDIWISNDKIRVAAQHVQHIAYNQNAGFIFKGKVPESAKPGTYTVYFRPYHAFAGYLDGTVMSFTIQVAGGTTYSVGEGVLADTAGKFISAYAGNETKLGAPTAMVKDASSGFGTSGYYQKFEKGSIQVHSGHTYIIYGTFYQAWGDVGYATWAGFPTSDRYSCSSGECQDFEGGYIHTDGTGAKFESNKHPQNLTVTRQADNSILLTWQNRIAASGINIFRTGSPTEIIATLGPGTTSYIDTTGVSGHQYKYSVQAFNDTAESPISNEATVNDWSQVVNFPGVKRIGSVIYGNNTYVARGYTNTYDPLSNTTTAAMKIFASTDLNTWTETYSETFSSQENDSQLGSYETFRPVQFLNNVFVATITKRVYSAFTKKYTTTIEALLSHDGKTWSIKYSEMLSGNADFKIQYLNNVFVATVNNDSNGDYSTNSFRILFSLDGNTWIQKYSDSFDSYSDADITGVNNRFVIFTRRHSYNSTSKKDTYTVEFKYSSDGDTWSQSYMETFTARPYVSIKNLNNTFVASVAQSDSSSTVKIGFSQDGVTWLQKYVGTSSGWKLPQIYYLNNIFIIIIVQTGDVLRIITSPDGNVWSEKYTDTTPANSSYYSIPPYYLNGMYVLGRPYEYRDPSTNVWTLAFKILFSPDGNVWSEKLSGVNEDGGYSIEYCNGNFFTDVTIINSSGQVTVRKILSSPDGNTWAESYSGTLMGDITCPNNQLLAYGAIGTNGVILRYGTTPTQTQQYMMTVSKSGTGSGTVTSSPVGIDCGTNCYATFDSGTSVTLTVVADASSAFAGWAGACTGTAATCTVVMNANMEATAAFTDIMPPVVTPSEHGGSYNSPQTLTLTPDEGATIYYTLDGTTPTTSSTQYVSPILITTPATLKFFAVDAAGNSSSVQTETFTITPTYVLSVTKSDTGSGTVTSNPTGIDCGNDCTERYSSGTQVMLTTVADASSTFTGWSGGVAFEEFSRPREQP